MQIEIRLRKLLQELGLDKYGIPTQIAREIEINRHVVNKIYHNEQSHPSLEVLGKICGWLQDRGIAAKDLPGVLFGAGSSDLWSTIASHGSVRIYLGAYQQIREGNRLSWIAQRDSAVETEIVRWLSTPANVGQMNCVLMTDYVPFRSDVGSTRAKRREFAEDCVGAERIFHQMRDQAARTTAILIGSQRVNYLVETVVADLFGCKPFEPRSTIQVPFYLTFPSRVRAVRSCFGGLRNPPGKKGQRRRGIYYLNADHQWELCHWVDGKEDAGIIITSYEPGTKAIQLIISGFTGLGTEAVGRKLIQASKNLFWPPYAESRGRKIGVYICKLKFVQHEGHPQLSDMTVTKLEEAILNKYLK